MLEPLKQWYCDTCGEIIESPEDGYVQFKRNDKFGYSDFIIVHHKSASPRKYHQKGCYQYSSDCDLESFLGNHGKIELLSMLDPGPYHMIEYESNDTNIRNWKDFFMRLQLPYYEEARRYWDRASTDGYFGDINEIMIYTPDYLKQMIEYYQREDQNF